MAAECESSDEQLALENDDDADEHESVEAESDAALELEVLRAEWEPEMESAHAFRVVLRGGAYYKKTKGVVADEARAFARFQAAKDWCDQFGWPREKSFSLALYTAPGAVALANEFCRRSNHYYDMWLASDDADDAFSFAHVAPPSDDEEFLDWITTLDADGASFAKGFELLELRPAR